jgi:transposase
MFTSLPSTEPCVGLDTDVKKTLRADEQERADIKVARHKWRIMQKSIDPHRLVFLDESGAATNMTRLRGRAKGGRRCHDRAPGGHWNTTTMISSIRLDGTTECMAIRGPTTGVVFREYVREVLSRTLRPGDIVVADNLSAHKDVEARELIEQAGAKYWPLPPYSPDLNPIEQMWSKVKAVLRRLKARTKETLYEGLAQALDSITPEDALGWFRACGYWPAQ